jgi:hypothetical protein
MTQTLLVIPHYRDSSRIEPFLEDLALRLPAHFAVLVSDDGSGPEETRRLCDLIASRQATASKGPVFLNPLLHPSNTGKGGAVRRGWMTGEGYSLLAFADADGSVNASEIARAERSMHSADASTHALFGSRVKMLGRSVKRTLHRHLMGRIFSTLIARVTGLDAYDTQCGLKIVRQDAFQKIKAHMACPGFAFDVELCLLLQKSGSVVREFPVDWADVSGSKVNLLSDSARMAVEVFRIRSRVDRLRFSTTALNP